MRSRLPKNCSHFYIDKQLSLSLGILLALEAIFGLVMVVYLTKLENSTLLAPHGRRNLTMP